MKKLALGILFFAAALFSFSFMSEENDTNVYPKVGIDWLTWEEALEKSKKTPRKVFIDVYTDWCGWCKRMDKTTFKDAEVIEYINENFYAVKLNGEQKEDIVWGDKTFKFVASGRRGYHELAGTLLNGRLGYPSFVMLDESFKRVVLSPGYKKPDQMMSELRFVAGNHYKTMSLEEYKRSGK